MKTQFTIILVLFCLFTVPFHAQEVEFNYEGRVSVDDFPFTGQGYFKFAIVNGDGSITYWSNDGTSTSGSEPAAAVVTDVTDGVFNVIIGDASNMNPLEASIFNGYEQVFLRVWFNDGVLGFEHLAPDRRITNPALLGSQSFREIHLYVNPAAGDDQYPGTSPAHPKQTIQAAWDSLPPMIRRDATIHLADGTYREEVLLKGKTVIGDATIAIVGNEMTPDSVRVTGADAGAETTPVRDIGFWLEDQRNVSIRGLLFDYCKRAGILANRNSLLSIGNCELLNNYRGASVVHSEVVAANVEIGDGLPTYSSQTQGIQVMAQGTLILENSNIYNQYFGITVARLSLLDRISGSTVDNCSHSGIYINQHGNCTFADPTNTISNCTTGLRAGNLSVVQGTPINFLFNGTNSVTSGGSVSPY